MAARPPGKNLPPTTPAPEAPEPDERTLFQEAVRDAHPLSWDRVHHQPPPPLAVPRQRQRDEASALRDAMHDPVLLDLHLEGGDEAAWSRPGLPPSVIRDLRRGRWITQANLDLHGMNRDEARQAIAAFLAECRHAGLRCVRIVHGKGLGSPGREPVLKKLVQGWLTQRREILAFCQARIAEGGSGALIALLQPSRKQSVR